MKMTMRGARRGGERIVEKGKEGIELWRGKASIESC